MKAKARREEKERQKQLKASQALQPQKDTKMISGPIMQIMSDDKKRQKSLKKKKSQNNFQEHQKEIVPTISITPSPEEQEGNQIEELEKLIKMFNLSVFNNNVWIEQNNHYYKSKVEIEELKQTIKATEKEIEELKLMNNQTTAAYIETIQNCGRDLEKMVLTNAIDLKKKNQITQDEIDFINKKIEAETDLFTKEQRDNTQLIQDIIPLEEDLITEIENVKKLKIELTTLNEGDGIPLDLLNRIEVILGAKTDPGF